LELGKAPACFLRIRSDLLTGVELLIVAIAGGLGLGGD
jgi:hypothetical protein